ncbi:hypothetical protein [Sinomonas mesophila]|uniref:hypothetical protein n=1 Tax=Sinomonas mesophila TaxID=1531955 RepID=UPI00158E59D3|nr:hypothetical protein [Sinomonas mesophila]
MSSHEGDTRVFTERRSAAIRQMLVEAPRAGTPTNRYFKKIHVAKVAIPFLALSLALTGGTVVLLNAPVTDKYQIKCFARAERNGSSFPGALVTMTAGNLGPEPRPDPLIAIEDAISVCSDLWAQHALDANLPSGVPDGPGQEDPTFSHPVPHPLTVCVWDGQAAVIPGDSSVCAKLGLSEKES